MKNHTVDHKILSCLKEKFNIISIIEFTDFDHDYSVLEDWLKRNYKKQYNSNDRFIITHFDTDFYINNNYGVILNNFFNLWKEYNIPLFTMFFYTNHHGINQEILKILKYNDPKDLPTVFETVVNKLNYPQTGHVEKDISIDDIEYHSLLLSGGTKRSHRFALYNEIKDLYPEKLLASIKSNT